MTPSTDDYRSGWERVFGVDHRPPPRRGLYEDVVAYFQRILNRHCDATGHKPGAVMLYEADWLQLRERADELARYATSPPPLDEDSREPFTLYGVTVIPK